VTTLRAQLRAHPRGAAALAFGASTAALTHFAWHADARLSGAIPAITVGAGLAHAVAGALTGPRLLDPARTATAAQAALLGAATSLLAILFFAPAFAWYVAATNTASSVGSFVGLVFFTALFAFLAAGWALLLLSICVAVGLYRLSDGR
jgi:hypothetical protein